MAESPGQPWWPSWHGRHTWRRHQAGEDSHANQCPHGAAATAEEAAIQAYLHARDYAEAPLSQRHLATAFGLSRPKAAELVSLLVAQRPVLVAEAMAWAEKTYGLTQVARGGPRGTAERRATRAETEKASREYKKAGRVGQPVPTRTRLRRLVEQAAAGARTEIEFFDALQPAEPRFGSGTARSSPPTQPAMRSACDPIPLARTTDPSGSAAAGWPRTSPCLGFARVGRPEQAA